MNSLICSACVELLYDPITLPCGNSVCQRCFRIKSQTYKCPAKDCPRKHYYRNESINIMLNRILESTLPKEQQAYSLIKRAELELKKFLEPTEKQCEEECIEIGLRAEIPQIIEVLDEAIKIAPNLQLGYLLRSKATQELGLFDQSIMDSKTAHRLNSTNKRGLVAEKLARWRIRMCESNLDVLANCAISALDDSNVKSTKVLEYSSQLRKEIACLSVESMEDTPLSYTLLSPDTVNLGQACLECTICLGTLVDPVTCPCGHTWCRKCIYDFIDVSVNCPLCRHKLPNIQYFVNRKSDKSLVSILSKFASETDIKANTRTDIIKEDKYLVPKSYEPIRIPLFVCSLVFPGSTPTFQMFEPRYRAMIKHAGMTDRQFGIIMHMDGQPAEFGTILTLTCIEEIRGSDLVTTSLGDLPRFIVETRACDRFKVISKDVVDDIQYATIQKVHDIDLEYLDHDSSDLDALFKKAAGFILNLLDSLPNSARLHFERKHGVIPIDYTEFCWWVAEFLPVDPHCLYELLQSESIVDRMAMVCGWVDQALLRNP